MGQPAVATIDGVDVSGSVISFSTVGGTFAGFQGHPVPFPAGTLTKLTVNGATEVVCGPYTLVLPAAAPAPAAIPTMGEWAMILLGLMLAGGAALYIQKRRIAA